MRNSVVAHRLDGKLVKGYSNDFAPNKATFHVAELDGGNITEVALVDLKAIFFVKTFEGVSGRRDDPTVERAGFGKRVQVRFKDGETMVGYTSGYSPGREVFFLFPADPESNNERILVVVAATEEVSFI